MVRGLELLEADMISGLTIDQFRDQAGDSSDFIIMDEHSAAYKRPSIQSDIAGFVKPFTPLVWVCVMVSLVVVLATFSLLSRTQHSLSLFITPFIRRSEGGDGGKSCPKNGQMDLMNVQPNPIQNVNRDAIFWSVCTLLAQCE
ncbi:hypothetical protein Pmani_010204 [Petrolisthes manimaculis]|uniref:Uncharacterized protein n=1 Tax=Petrolisthes manimaculis TaxID=1843537 RepID=A0AAE1Q2F1_9EUCA|nr:hypothetical protein Pmani_010204 [Petrolisthes manimaculis]